MTNNTPNWASFWKNNPVGFDAIMQESAVFVREKLLAHQIIKPSDVLLDMGCGPGLLVAELQNKVKTIIGADISEAYIDICKNKFQNSTNLFFLAFPSFDYTSVAASIAEQNVNKVIILSVLQYYQTEVQVRDLIIALKNAATTRTSSEPLTCIIADLLPKNHSFIADVRDLVLLALRKGFVFSLIKFILYTLYSDYRKFKKVGLLHLNYDFFEKIASEQGLKISKTPQITMHTDRYSVLLTF
jgi:SAM-dependent methyltransferase